MKKKKRDKQLYAFFGEWQVFNLKLGFNIALNPPKTNTSLLSSNFRFPQKALFMSKNTILVKFVREWLVKITHFDLLDLAS